MSGWTPHRVTTPPSGAVLTTDDALAHCAAPASDAALVAGYVAAAVDMVQSLTGAKLLTQTVSLQRADLPCRMALPIGPVQSVALTYLDSTGTSQTLDASIYALTGAGTLAPAIELLPGKSWPALLPHPAAVTLTAVAGFGAAAQVPPAIVQAVRLLVADWYLNREDTIAERGVVPATLPNGVVQLLANWRVFG